MDRASNIIYSIQAIIGVLFAIFVGYVAYINSIDGRPDLTPGRILLSGILVMYSVIQIALLYKSHVTKMALFSYPVIYFTFGLYWEYSSGGYIKNWAPATHEDAFNQNIFCLFILVFLAALALLTTFKKGKNTNGA
ncbi:MAG: hypothetical protein P8171_17135 [Candidatus Thiodiazotropha sp.]